jgi:hypothetical protein
MQPIHFPGQGFIPGKTPFTCAKPQSDDAGEAKTPVSNYAINDGTLPRSGLVQDLLCGEPHNKSTATSRFSLRW